MILPNGLKSTCHHPNPWLLLVVDMAFARPTRPEAGPVNGLPDPSKASELRATATRPATAGFLNLREGRTDP